MKKYLVVILSSILLFSCSDQDKKTEENKDLLSTDLVNNPHSATGTDKERMSVLPTMDFKDSTHDFGTINDGEKVIYDFKFTNNGKSPLIISGATGSCGCTVPSYPNDPIKPGESGAVKVMFDGTNKSGHQEKSVVLTTNSKKGTHMLYIKADVVPVSK